MGRAGHLPEDPDASAERLGKALGCAIVISDSFGRPWRMGVVAVGIGYAAQQIDAVPVTSRDARLDLVLTERETIDLRGT